MNFRRIFLVLPVLVMAGCADRSETNVSAPETNQVHAAAPAEQPASRPPLREPLEAIVAMTESGLAQGVIESHIALATNRFNILTEEILVMKEAGVSQAIIFAILQRDTQLRSRSNQVTRQQAVANAEARARIRAQSRELALTRALLTAQSNQFAAELAEQRARTALQNQPRNRPAPAVNLPPQVQPFHTALNPHGSWLQHATLGWIWQPNVLAQIRDWRPYAHNGRWLSTDQGWYWHSDEPWGWAVFHYGRWGHDLKLGWYWVPDTTWGPSWVTFRSEARHLGWAPLPPGANFTRAGLSFRGQLVGLNYAFGLGLAHYSFVPYRRVFHPQLFGHILAPNLVRPFFQRTTVINNVINTGNSISNPGFSIQRVRQLSLQPITLGVIRISPVNSFRQFGLSRQEGGHTVVFRPSIQHIAPVKPAVITQNGTNRTVLVPASTPDGTVIAGRPVVDHSTGRPVVTGYTTRPQRTAPIIINNIINGTNVSAATQPVRNPSTPRNGGPIPQNIALQQARSSGFFLPNQARSGPRPMSPPRPITSVPQPLGPPQPVGYRQPATNSTFRYNPGSSSYYNRR